MVVDELTKAVDRLCDADPQQLGDGETLLALLRQQNRLSAAISRAAAAFDRSGSWQGSGARSATAWITARSHLPRLMAARHVRLGRALPDMPATECSWLAGDMSDAHASVLNAARRPVTESAFGRDEAMLVDHAATMRFSNFVKAVDYWTLHADPDGSVDRDQRRVEARRAHCSTTFGGMVAGQFTLDPINGAIFQAELRRLEQTLFEADWQAARQRVGDGATAFDLARTPAQRRADALVEMATRSASAPAGGRRPEPLFSVLVGYETLKGTICELAKGTVVAPASLVPWLDQAWLERVVFDPASRVIDLGHRQRLFRGAARHAVLLRDRECFNPTCEEPAERCQVDHIVPWAEGGPTDHANGRPACAFHNRRRNHRRRPPPADD